MAGMQETLDRAAAQLKEMSLSQRVAILLGVTLVAGSLAWMVNWAATPEYLPLMADVMSTEEAARVSGTLTELNQPHRQIGAQIYVPASANRASLLAQLTQAGQMPKNTSMTFEQIVKEANPWLPQAENTRRWTLALQNQLTSVLQNFAGVETAQVFLNLNSGPRPFSRNAPSATASVSLRMTGDLSVPRALAINAAKLVSGAVNGLALKDVRVTDGSGNSIVSGNEEDTGGMTELSRQRRATEREFTDRIQRQLDHIPDVRVSVQIVLDRTARSSDSADVAEGAKTSKRTYEEENNQARQSGQPGAQPNVGVAVGEGGNRNDSSRRTESSEAYAPSVTNTMSNTPAGGITQAFAAISIPDTYLTEIFRRNNPDAPNPPAENDLEQIFERLELRLSPQIAKLVRPPTADQIDLQWHYTTPPEEPAAASSVNSSVEMATRYAPIGLLGMLAMFSLFFITRMARSGAQGAEAFAMELGLSEEAIEAARRADTDLNFQEDPANASVVAPDGVMTADLPLGAAADNVLEAQEISEEMAQINNMLAQVGGRIDEDEELIASMLERWIAN